MNRLRRLYTNPNWWPACTGNTRAFAASDPLWIADYDTSSPVILPGDTFWQDSIATELVNTASGLCASVPASGTRLVIAACGNTPATTWHLE